MRPIAQHKIEVKCVRFAVLTQWTMDGVPAENFPIELQ